MAQISFFTKVSKPLLALWTVILRRTSVLTILFQLLLWILLTHSLLELFKKNAGFLDILVLFKLDLSKLALIRSKMRLQHNSLPTAFYYTVTWACAEIKLILRK